MMGQVSIDLHVFWFFGKGVMAVRLDIYHGFGPVVGKSTLRVFGRDQKDALRKVMQSRGGFLLNCLLCPFHSF